MVVFGHRLDSIIPGVLSSLIDSVILWECQLACTVTRVQRERASPSLEWPCQQKSGKYLKFALFWTKPSLSSTSCHRSWRQRPSPGYSFTEHSSQGGLRLSAGPSAAGLRRGGIRWIHREPPHPHGAAGRRGERWGRPLAAEGKRRRQARDAGSAPAAAGCGAAVGGGGGDGGSGGVGVGRRRGPSAAPPRPPAPSHAVVMEEPRWRRWPTPGASGRSTTTSAWGAPRRWRWAPSCSSPPATPPPAATEVRGRPRALRGGPRLPGRGGGAPAELGNRGRAGRAAGPSARGSRGGPGRCGLPGARGRRLPRDVTLGDSGGGDPARGALRARPGGRRRPRRSGEAPQSERGWRGCGGAVFAPRARRGSGGTACGRWNCGATGWLLPCHLCPYGVISD